MLFLFLAKLLKHNYMYTIVINCAELALNEIKIVSLFCLFELGFFFRHTFSLKWDVTNIFIYVFTFSEGGSNNSKIREILLRTDNMFEKWGGILQWIRNPIRDRGNKTSRTISYRGTETLWMWHWANSCHVGIVVFYVLFYCLFIGCYDVEFVVLMLRMSQRAIKRFVYSAQVTLSQRNTKRYSKHDVIAEY